MSKQPIFTGSGVAIVTPFTENNEVNYPLLGELIDFQIENGTDAIIICGTTGEGSTPVSYTHLTLYWLSTKFVFYTNL